MRILLCYPPLFPSESAEDLRARDDQDNTNVPIGLYVLGAQLVEQGHEVVLENLALTPWSQALARIEAARPELLGVTCYTFHRHHVARLTREVRERSPKIQIVVGGVHVSMMPLMTLERWPWVDFVAVGEADTSLPALAGRLARGEGPAGLLGIAHRDGDGVGVLSGRAPPVSDLDSLPIAARYWPHWIVSTSRGCPFACTFCASPAIWGRKVRVRSPEHVLRELELLRGHGLTQVAFKDETFTFKRSRVEALCRAMIDARLNLWWSCDTRADCLDEQRLTWMRRAGCFEISLGVETGAPRLIDYYEKREKAEKVIAATRLARRFGIHVRHYYIVGAPAESERTLRQTARLIRRSRPQRVFVSTLAVLPGSAIQRQLSAERGWDDSMWFDQDAEWIHADPRHRWERLPGWRALRRLVNTGVDRGRQGLLNPLTLSELEAAAERVPDAFACAYDLAQKLIEIGEDERACRALGRALDCHPQSCKAWLDLAGCLRRLGRPEEALVALAQVEAVRHPIGNNPLVAMLQRAELLEALGRPQEALLVSLRLVRRAPRAVQAVELARRLLATVPLDSAPAPGVS